MKIKVVDRTRKSALWKLARDLERRLTVLERCSLDGGSVGCPVARSSSASQVSLVAQSVGCNREAVQLSNASAGGVPPACGVAAGAPLVATCEADDEQRQPGCPGARDSEAEQGS